MKKKIFSILSLLLVFGLLCTAMFALAGCGDEEDADEEGGSGINSNEGTYYLYSYGKLDKDVFVRLSGGKWMLNADGTSLGGTYGISGGKIVFRYTVDTEDEVGMLLMSEYDAKAGQTLDVITGKIGSGKLLLETMMGEALPGETVFYQESKAPGGGSGSDNGSESPTGGSTKIDGTYVNEELGETVVFSGGTWTVLTDGETFMTGTYTLNGNVIKLKGEVYGEEVEISNAIWSGDSITVEGTVYTRKK